ncbi:hypothetical protein P7K49_022422, partial [Saguinus oedipus]
RLGAVVRDQGEAASVQDMVVGSLHWPVEVQEAEVVIAGGTRAHRKRSSAQALLQQ